MPIARRRKKQPDVLRPQLLQSAGQLALEAGLRAVTLEAVAARAGVSKGGLQYHFPNKQALLDALFDETLAAFKADMLSAMAEDPDTGGRAARGYIHASLQESRRNASDTHLHLLLAMMLTDPETRARWSPKIVEINRPEPLPDAEAARLMICRLAADGLWLAELLGYQSMPPSLYAEVLRQIDQMTRNNSK